MTERTRSRRDDRAQTILDAAGAVLRRGGGRALTIDAVAAQAGLSKGGVLHHYGSKDALILALVARKLAELREGIAACEAQSRPGPTVWRSPWWRICARPIARTTIFRAPS